MLLLQLIKLSLFTNQEAQVQELGKDAYERIWYRDYELHVHFVTCKSVSDNLRADIKSDFYRIQQSKITVVSVDEVLSTAEQYFDGEVPAIDKMTAAIEAFSKGVAVVATDLTQPKVPIPEDVKPQ